MNHPMESERADSNQNMKTPEVDPKELERLQKMGEKIHLVLRMAAMELLKKTEDGFLMCVPQMPEMPMPAQSLFAVYLALEEQYAGDWEKLDRALQAPWMDEVIQMVLNPQRYVLVWRELRMTLISEALPLLKRYAGEEKLRDDSKFFTLIGLQICDKVITTLTKDNKTEKNA